MSTQNLLSLPPAGRATRLQPSGVGVNNLSGLSLNAPPRNSQTTKIAHQFETIIAATLLRSARAANLGDDGLGATAGPLRDMIDQNRAEIIARAAPLGVAKLLEKP